ncbi:hypothetical protein FHG87_019333 [Trinorchestia longiramus]|nr:hypothetical protein FHG87_019333 [Trinorchestia longiramus]
MKDKLENNMNSTGGNSIHSSNEHNLYQTQSHTQPAGILELFRNFYKSANKKMRNFNGTTSTSQRFVTSLVDSSPAWSTGERICLRAERPGFESRCRHG